MTGLPHSLSTLLDAQAFPHPVRAVRLIETSISWVLLTGDFAYKIKRPVVLPFLDLRSAALRRHLCFEEVRLNSRFAPDLYVDVCAITQAGSQVRVGGDGAIVEHAVRMRQFEAAAMLDELIRRQCVDAAALERFGAELAGLHESLPAAHEPGGLGDPALARTMRLRNLEECRQAFESVGSAEDFADLRLRLTALHEELHALLLERWRRGRVRECHGDLHARNVVQRDSGLVAFDCLEFEPSFRWIDVGLEVAFLYMDLLVRGVRRLALAFLSGYLQRSGDHGLLRLLPLHVADRALVRAKVAALEMHEASGAAVRDSAARRAADYLHLARQQSAVRADRGRLILMCGLSGSGKSWLAAGLADRMLALHLRSDSLRRHASVPGEAAYSAAATSRTYEFLAASAADALAGGLDVIVDATFLRRANRADFRRLAAIHGARMSVIVCTAPEEVRKSRVLERTARHTDPSEATPAVIDWQRERQEPVMDVERLHVLEVDTTREDVLDATWRQLVMTRLAAS